MSRWSLAGAAVVAVLLLSACAPQDPPRPSAPGPGPAAGRAAAQLPSSGTADYQLGGGYPPPSGTTVVARDSTEEPANGTYGICYVNGFQTQPGEGDRWEALDVVLHDGSGQPVVDPGWPDELLLDTSTPERRAVIVEQLTTELTRCAEAGYAAVELDNLDSWTRSDGRLTQADAVALATGLAAVAHELGLAVAQKNTPDLGAQGRDEVGFDLAVAEECVRYDECDDYTGVYGGQVLDVEYVQDGQSVDDRLTEVCASPGRPSLLVVRDVGLAPAGAPGHAYGSCPR